MRRIYAYIWEFYVKPGCESNFEHMYGEDGNWVKLFKQEKGYLHTELFHDASNSLRYLTIDYWESKSAFETFKNLHKNEFETLDIQCEKLTERETFISAFHQLTKQ